MAAGVLESSTTRLYTEDQTLRWTVWMKHLAKLVLRQESGEYIS